MKATDKRFSTLTLAGLIGALGAGVAIAASPAPAEFKALDQNRDGRLSLQEFVANGAHERAFRAGDANRDNALSSDEFIKASANDDRIKAAKFVDDAAITAKVKALLLKDEGVKSLDVNVETYRGTVQLSGWVRSPEQMARAEQVAASVEGVKAVRNDLQVKG